MKAIHLFLLQILSGFCLMGCAHATHAEKETLPRMPMSMPYENTLEYTWSQKKVLDSKLLSDAETMGPWEHRGRFGSLALTQEKKYKGNSSLMITSPTKGPDRPPGGRPWGTSNAYYKVANEDWTDWNRISFWIYPDLPGFKVVSISTVFHNDGEEKVPDSYARNGVNYQVLENHKWNKVYWEIEHLGRDNVTGFEILYRLQGNEPGSTEEARYYIDEVYLEKVEPDHYEGWNVSPGELAYNHAGYTVDYPKMAYTPDTDVKSFTLIDADNGQTVLEKEIEVVTTPLGTFRVMDFTEYNTAGRYRLQAGNKKTPPFVIGSFSDVYRSSIIKTINHFYTQRCGFAVEGIHDVCHVDWVCNHGDPSIPINGGWHDAGDLSQGLGNTGEATYSMLILGDKMRRTDPELAERILDEAEWGLDWVLKVRFGDGYRNTWATMDMWTDNIIGSADDSPSRAQNSPHANFVSATAEAAAGRILKDRNPERAAYALQCAIEDWDFAYPRKERMNIDLAGAGLNASLELLAATGDEKYKNAAFEYADYIMQCQQKEALDSGVALKGFFYTQPSKETILHYPHRSNEQDAVAGLVKLSELYPGQSAEWVKTIRLYADFYKESSAYQAPYYMIPAGIYDLTKARDEVETEQISGGIRLNDRYYLKRFPVWTEFRGNSGTILTQGRGLSLIGHYLKDKELLDIVYRQLDWHLGINPFAQSLMYGEGYRYAGQYSVTSGNLIGGLPVGVQTHFNRDEPYWPAENCYNWKEIWVNPSFRWLMLMHDFIQ